MRRDGPAIMGQIEEATAEQLHVIWENETVSVSLVIHAPHDNIPDEKPYAFQIGFRRSRPSAGISHRELQVAKGTLFTSEMDTGMGNILAILWAFVWDQESSDAVSKTVCLLSYSPILVTILIDRNFRVTCSHRTLSLFSFDNNMDLMYALSTPPPPPSYFASFSFLIPSRNDPGDSIPLALNQIVVFGTSSPAPITSYFSAFISLSSEHY